MRRGAKTGGALALLSPDSLLSLRRAEAARQILQVLDALPPALSAGTLACVVWALARETAAERAAG